VSGSIGIKLADMSPGMAKAVADVNDPDEKQGGFASGDSLINGFSHMHDSGKSNSWSIVSYLACVTRIYYGVTPLVDDS
jgi:hypothetical protein